MSGGLTVRYYVAGRKILEDCPATPPRRGDEVCLGGRHYRADRVVWHLPMCPPDSVNVHLVMCEAEEIAWAPRG